MREMRVRGEVELSLGMMERLGNDLSRGKGRVGVVADADGVLGWLSEGTDIGGTEKGGLADEGFGATGVVGGSVEVGEGGDGGLVSGGGAESSWARGTEAERLSGDEAVEGDRGRGCGGGELGVAEEGGLRWLGMAGGSRESLALLASPPSSSRGVR